MFKFFQQFFIIGYVFGSDVNKPIKVLSKMFLNID
jgi:hypothetical protein